MVLLAERSVKGGGGINTVNYRPKSTTFYFRSKISILMLLSLIPDLKKGYFLENAPLRPVGGGGLALEERSAKSTTFFDGGFKGHYFTHLHIHVF